MEAIFTAFIGELATRSLSFLVDRYLKPAPSKKNSIQRLEQMLLRIRLTVEEAERRCITSQAMLQQLNILRRVMYRGYYMIDTFIQQVPEEDDQKDHDVSHSLSLSKFSPAKRFCFSTGGKYGTKNIEEMLEYVEIAIAGMSEFVIFLRNYPPMFRQPYSTYLFIEKCMFGRQMEMEWVINFLLHEEPSVDGNFGVLPIVGPEKVGKTTLVEYVCCDERVRNHFSHIIFLSDNDFGEENQCSLIDRGRIKRQHGDSNEEIFLVIIELVGNIDESAWRRLHSASESSIPTGSKVIITSRSNSIINFGTTQALTLKFLSREAYWYFFKALVFGSADPEEQPELASIAKAIFDEYFVPDVYTTLTGPFIYLGNTAISLKSSVDVRNWRKILGCFRDNRRRNELISSRSQSDLGMDSDHTFLKTLAVSTQYCVVHNHGRIGLEKEDVPELTLQEILTGDGSIRPHGKFDTLVWESHLPPYQKHIHSCEILEFECEATTRNNQGQKRKLLS